MLDEQLKRRGKLIVEELELGVNQTTEKWMAHYLVELMDRAEKAETEELRMQSAKQSAEIILTLWEQKKSQTRHEFYSALNNSLAKVYERRDFADVLKSVLEHPEHIAEAEDFRDHVTLLFYLGFYETDLLRLYLIADIATKIENGEIAKEVAEEFENTEDLYLSTKSHLQDVWPKIEKVGLSQIPELRSLIVAKLGELQRLRNRLQSQLTTN